MILDEFFERYKDLFQWHRPKAGAIGFVEIKFKMSVLDFVKDLVKKLKIKAGLEQLSLLIQKIMKERYV